MKRQLTTALLALATAGFAVTASATPVFGGDPDANYGEGNNPPLPNDSGYYVWRNSSGGGTESWSIRWTGNDNHGGGSCDSGASRSDGDGTCDLWNWAGNIEVANGANSVDSVQFEAGGSGGPDTIFVNGAASYFEWNAVAGSVWDGIDFNINQAGISVIGFNLASDFFDHLGLDDGSGNQLDVPGSNIFIGQHPNESTPNVLINQLAVGGGTTYTSQQFEIGVPAPAVAGLLGLGLIVMGGIGRRKPR